jgi:hypothetical protein
MRKLILDGLALYQLEKACQAYARKELNLSAAARYAGVSIYEMMSELEKRSIPVNASVEKFLDGIQNFAEAFGSSPALQQALAEAQQK